MDPSEWAVSAVEVDDAFEYDGGSAMSTISYIVKGSEPDVAPSIGSEEVAPLYTCLSDDLAES